MFSPERVENKNKKQKFQRLNGEKYNLIARVFNVGWSLFGLGQWIYCDFSQSFNLISLSEIKSNTPCDLCDSSAAGGEQLKMDLNQLSSKIIGAAIEVHKTLGPGLLESTYEECLCHELGLQGIKFERQVSLPVCYKDKRLDCGYRIDIIVEHSIVLELKAVDAILAIHKAQLITYLKLSNLQLGLLLNFNITLMRDGIHRIVNQLKQD